MKNCIYVLLLLASNCLHAQLQFDVIDSIDINNINAVASVHGTMWSDPELFNYTQCRFPKGNTNDVASFGSVWLSGYNEGNELHIAAQTHRSNGIDFWPGPLDARGSLSHGTSYAWAKIWKVNQADILAFRATFKHTRENTPYSILTWPGKGNSFARGNMSSPLVIDREMAPFADLNGNGIYEPLLGEYPAIKGDQALWWVFSDNGPSHRGSNGRPLGVEVTCMAYGYSRNTLIDNVVYYEYDMKNRSASSYHDVRMAFSARVEMGLDMSEYIGFDSIHREAIWYFAGTDSYYVKRESGYQYTPPVGGLTIVHMSGDENGQYLPTGSFGYFYNSYNHDSMGIWMVDSEYNNYMRSRWRDGIHFTNDFAGPGITSNGRGGSTDCNYIFPGDPQDPTTWSECVSGNWGGGESIVLSTDDFDLPVGSTRKVVFALVVAPRDSSNFCPTISFDKIREVADTAWGNYYNPPPVLAENSNLPFAGQSLKLYPNPAQNSLHIAMPGGAVNNTEVHLYNTLGQQLVVPMQQLTDGYRVDIATLVPGMYHITLQVGDTVAGASFQKE